MAVYPMAYPVRSMKHLRKCIGTKCMMFFKTSACCIAQMVDYLIAKDRVVLSQDIAVQILPKLMYFNDCKLFCIC